MEELPRRQKGRLRLLDRSHGLGYELGPLFYQNRRMLPLPVDNMEQMRRRVISTSGSVTSVTSWRPALHRTARPHRDPDRRCCLWADLHPGIGTINGMELSSPNLIRFGQLTHDEYFVTQSASSEDYFHQPPPVRASGHPAPLRQQTIVMTGEQSNLFLNP